MGIVKNWAITLCLLLLSAPAAFGATFVVTDERDNINSGDSNPGDGVCEDITGGVRCTLRAAIEEANANPVADVIEFLIPFNIVINNTALPNIVGVLTIDGRTALGYNSDATNIADAPPKVYLDGSALAGIASADGLHVNNFLTNVYALGIINFPDKGIDIDSPAGSVGIIDANWIGVTTAGLAAGNGTGIQLSGTRTFVGAATQAGYTPLGNLISGNDGYGISVVLGDDNEIKNNRIGTVPNGASALPNGSGGIKVVGNANIIGGLGDGNILAFNNGPGIELVGNQNKVRGNAIVFNTSHGVMAAGTGNEVGFAGNPDLGNLIDDNGGTGILFGNVGSAVSALAGSNIISDNNGDGIRLVNGNGGSFISNSIYRNVGNGIRLDTDNNSVAANQIGYRNTETSPIIGTNTGNGVVVNGSNNTIGGGNRIGGSASAAHEGVDVWSGDNNVISGNRIGMTNNFVDIGNAGAGIRADVAASNLKITDNKIGFNLDGIHIMAAGTRICGNHIGSDAFVDFGNNREGIWLQSNGNIIGSEADDCASNIMGFNNSDGIQIEGNDNLIADNLMGHNGGSAGNTLSFPNGAGAVLLTLGAQNNSLMNNVMATNGSAGARLGPTAGTGNDFLTNIMFGNSRGLGIDLYDNGITANDPNDADEGPNRGQNFPELISTTNIANQVTVDYRIDSALANANYPMRVDFFIAQGNVPEGKTFVASDSYNLAPNATRQFQFFHPILNIVNLTATATDANGNTSEFSIPIHINPPAAGEEMFKDGFED